MLDKFEKYLAPKNLMFIGGIIIFLVLMCTMQDIAIMFFAAFVISCSLNPFVDKLSKKISRNKASAIVLGVVFLFIALIFVPLIAMAGHEISAFAESFPKYFHKIVNFVENSPFLNQINLENNISSASGFTSGIVNNVVDFGQNIGSGFVYLLATVIIIYYFLADKDLMASTFLKMFPKSAREKAGYVSEIITNKVGGYMVGLILSMASVGIVMTIGLLLLRVDYAIILGLITAVLDIVPVVGPGIALAICLVAAYNSSPFVLLMIVVVFAIAQLLENNLVKPYVFGKLLDIHPVIIYLFLFITAKCMGVIGVIFSPAIAAIVCVLIQELYMKKLEEDSTEE